MSEVLDHIVRPLLPWRSGCLTECGKDGATVDRVITRDEMIAKIKDQGKQRAAMSSCMTCWSTAEWNRDWARSPTEVMAREVQRGFRSRQPVDTQLDRELRAIAELIGAHREEFDGFLAGLDEAGNLDVRRRERQRLRSVDPQPRRF